ncbi:MAG: sulfatase-like hydrolase/transferase [Planctomycetota bacterium]
MEAHRPLLPSDAARERFMTPEQVRRSHELDLSWPRVWAYTFGLEELDDADLEVVRRTYDAALYELDALFEGLVDELRRRGVLDDTIVVLTSDHGELLGDGHVLGHHYSLAEGVVRVPLVLRAPGRVAAGRDATPVQNLDVGPTLLRLAGLRVDDAGSRARDLLLADTGRARVAEYLVRFEEPFRSVSRDHPDFDPEPFRSRIRALWSGDEKLVWRSDGRGGLYDLARDPREEHDVAGERGERAKELARELQRTVAGLDAPSVRDADRRARSEEERRRLERLGYLDGGR